MLSIKSECLDRMVLIGERHLRRTIGSYMDTIMWSDATRDSEIVRSKAFQNPPEAWFCAVSGWAGS